MRIFSKLLLGFDLLVFILILMTFFTTFFHILEKGMLGPPALPGTLYFLAFFAGVIICVSLNLWAARKYALRQKPAVALEVGAGLLAVGVTAYFLWLEAPVSSVIGVVFYQTLNIANARLSRR